MTTFTTRPPAPVTRIEGPLQRSAAQTGSVTLNVPRREARTRFTTVGEPVSSTRTTTRSSGRNRVPRSTSGSQCATLTEGCAAALSPLANPGEALHVAIAATRSKLVRRNHEAIVPMSQG